MKNTLILLLSAFALCASAKNAAELVAEFNAKAAHGCDFPVAMQIAAENSADVAAAIPVWTADADLLKSNEELSAEQRKNAQAARMIAGQYLTANPEAIKTLPLRFACHVISSKVVDVFGADNPNFYADLKAADFKIDGVRLPVNSIVQMACTANDAEYIASMPVSQAVQSPRYIDVMARWLLESDDISASIKKAQEIETYYITAGKEVPSKLKAVLTALARRLATSKM